ncbi:MAG: DUF3592 domain-containing protein [Bacteriovoracaceae bacterium]|nr:DUF3592 domain-containing protein [Bacteriovoracaceae bacterium]
MAQVRRLNPFAGVILGFLFLIGGGVGMYFGYSTFDLARSSNSWPSVAGEIVGSSLSTSTSTDSKGRRSTTYRANIVFKYTVNGKNFRTNTPWIGAADTSSSNRSGAQSTVNKYQVGAQAKVFYNPKQPSVAVLEPGVTFDSMLLLLFGGIFFLVGGLTFVGSMFKIFAVAMMGGAGILAFLNSNKNKLSTQSLTPVRSKKLHKPDSSDSSDSINSEQQIDLDDEMDYANQKASSSIYENDWYVLGKNKRYGPYPLSKIQKYLSVGKIKEKTKCESVVDGSTITVKQLLEHKDAA